MHLKLFWPSSFKESSNLIATGIPPHILLANEIKSINFQLTSKQDKILEKLDLLPESIKSTILDNFSVDGAIPITHDQVLSMLTDMKHELKDIIEN